MKKKTILVIVLICLLTATLFTSCDEIMVWLGLSSPQSTRPQNTVPATPPAAPASDFHYDLNNEGTGIVIKRYIGSNPNLVIPQRIEGYPVLEISSGIIAPKGLLVSVVIPEGVKSIVEGFRDQQNLQTVRLPNSLEVIGFAAFSNCKNLTQINIPTGIKEIGDLVFYRCTSLSNLIIPNSITSIKWKDEKDNRAFADCGALPLATRQRLKDLGYPGRF